MGAGASRLHHVGHSDDPRELDDGQRLLVREIADHRHELAQAGADSVRHTPVEPVDMLRDRGHLPSAGGGSRETGIPPGDGPTSRVAVATHNGMREDGAGNDGFKLVKPRADVPRVSDPPARAATRDSASKSTPR
jgi:hypothetical protein